MSIILLILTLVGAIPEIIEAVKAIWELIKKIRDRGTRAEMRAKLRKVISDQIDQEKMQVKNAVQFVKDLSDLEDEVLAILEAEHADVQVAVAAKAAKKA